MDDRKRSGVVAAPTMGHVSQMAPLCNRRQALARLVDAARESSGALGGG